MSIKIMNEVWEHAPVTQGTLLVLLALADAADEGTRMCFPGIARLAKFARLQERQVHNCLRELRDGGIIAVDRGKGPAGTNLYTIKKPSEWGVQKLHHLQSSAAGPAIQCSPDLQPIAPKPSVEPSEEPSDLFGSVEPQRNVREAKAEKQDRFDEFWSVYPKKAGKPAAQKAWDKAIKKTDPEKIIAAASVYAGTDGVARGFVKYPQGWLNEERFNDADLQPQPPVPPPSQPPRSQRFVYHAGGVER